MAYGRTGAVRERLEVLLGDQVRVMGPDHPNTLKTRTNLAVWRGHIGRADDVMEQLEALLADQVRVLGPDHPETVRTRAELLYWCNENGQSRQ